MGYRIREWRERYEVNDKGGPWKEGDGLRRTRLEFVRSRVHGHSLPLGFRKLNRHAGRDAPAVFGLFCKLLEVAADNTPDLRGFLCNTQGRALTDQEIADTLDWPRDFIARGMTMLCDPEIGWVEIADAPHPLPVKPDDSKHSRDSGNSRSSGSSGVIQNNTSQDNKNKYIPPTAVALAAPCPLVSFPRLQKLYPGIREHLQGAHPKAKLPKVESKQGIAERETLARLIRLDGYREGEVIHALRWVLKAESEQADFWRSNFRAIGQLRKVKDGGTKFTKIFDAMQRDTDWPEVPPDPVVPLEAPPAEGEAIQDAAQ